MSTQTQNYTVNDLGKVVQLAREQAVLGVYNESPGNFKIGLTLIQSRSKQINDDFLKEKWRYLEAQIKSEISGVSEIVKVGNTFKV